MSATPHHESEDLLSPARTAAILGIIAMSLQMTSCCTSVLGIFGGSIAGAIALFVAIGVRRSEPTGAAQAYANVGFWSGLLSVIWGVIVGLAIFAYIMLYVVMIVVMVVAGGASGGGGF